MGLETTTYISGLTAAWPLASDKKNQGDDHLRLIKATLQSTFPGASKPFYFPSAEVSTANMILDVTDQNNDIFLDTTSGALTITLPSGFGTAEKGWKTTIIKSSTDANGITVSPASGNITSKVGNTATVRVGCAFEPTIFVWTGTAWICYKPGSVIGATYNWDATTTPAGFLDVDGSSFSNTTFAELFAVLGTSTLKDKRGRVEIGSGTGSGLTNRVLGTDYGAETVALALTDLPTGITAAGINAISVNSTNNLFRSNNGAVDQGIIGGTGTRVGDNTSAIGIATSTGNNNIAVTANNTGGTNHANIQPSVAVKKIIRAC
jgi:microcystin-dependent protein